MSKELNELIKELGTILDGSNQLSEEFDTLKSLYETLKVEVAEEFDYPFEENDLYWSIDIDGDLFQDQWNCSGFDKNCFKLGNAFKTEQEALKELDRRILLTRFRQFRDKCNGDWKPESDEVKYYIFLKHKNFSVSSNMMWDFFNLFGYFKNIEDAERAIELFGDEIKRLWVDE